MNLNKEKEKGKKNHFRNWELLPTRTDSPSSGFGQRTEEKLGSGSFCSGTGIGGAKPKVWKACRTKTCPTPWKEEWTNFNGQLMFSSLRDT